jgi:hypothetical protein
MARSKVESKLDMDTDDRRLDFYGHVIDGENLVYLNLSERALRNVAFRAPRRTYPPSSLFIYICLLIDSLARIVWYVAFQTLVSILDMSNNILYSYPLYLHILNINHRFPLPSIDQYHHSDLSERHGNDIMTTQ